MDKKTSIQNLKKIKKREYPVLLGTTSYIIPDHILPNARVLCPVVDDIELVLFESPDFSNIPSKDDIRELALLAKDHGTGYTIHLPTDRKAGSTSKKERQLLIDGARKIIDRFSVLSPRGWVLHLEGIKHGAEDEERKIWADRCGTVASSICSAVDSPESVAIENLSYPWFWHRNISEKTGSSLCCDVGHLWLHYPEQWKAHLDNMLPLTRVIHLHGVASGSDHLSLARGDKSTLEEFMHSIKTFRYNGVVTIEIFSEKDLSESLDVFSRAWDKNI